MKLRKLKRGSRKKHKPQTSSPHISMLLDRAASCIEYGRFPEAEDICRRVIARSPRTSEAYNILGVIYKGRGLFNEALTFLHKAVGLDPANANAFFNLGTALGQLGRYEEAAAAFRKGLALTPRNVQARSNLGLTLFKMGRLDEAIRTLEKTVEQDPHFGDAWFNLADARYCRGLLQQSVDAYRKCIGLVPDFTEAHYNLGIVLHDLGMQAEAVRALQRTIELDPGHAAASHMLAALSGETPDSAPPHFVTNLFDQYADRFDADLVNRLEYTVPSRLRELLLEYVEPSSRFARAVDLGCGTGLSGEAFRDMADYLAGIDISGKMLAKAREKAVYDELRAGDLCFGLQQIPGLFDLFIAADVMIYIGNLAPLFDAVGSRAQPGAFFAFSVESQEGQDFTLQATGRYAHDADYIFRLAAAADFAVIARQKTGIRKENETWIPGEIYILQKKTA